MKCVIFFWTVLMLICGAFSSASHNHHLNKHHRHRQFRDLETSSSESPHTFPPEESLTAESNPGGPLETFPPQANPGNGPPSSVPPQTNPGCGPPDSIPPQPHTEEPYACPLCLIVCLDTTSTADIDTTSIADIDTTSTYFPTYPARRHKNVVKKSHYKKHYFVRHGSVYTCPPCGCYYPPTTSYPPTDESTETTTYTPSERKHHTLHHVKHQVLKKKHHNGH